MLSRYLGHTSVSELLRDCGRKNALDGGVNLVRGTERVQLKNELEILLSSQ